MRVLLAALIVYLFAVAPLYAGDPTGYWKREAEAGRAPPKEWWDNLASGKGLCCSFADGLHIDDVDWDTGYQQCERGSSGGDGNAQVEICKPHYRVHINGEWIVVPENAVVTEPNKFGPAVVWPYMDSVGATQIRCFLPGAGT